MEKSESSWRETSRMEEEVRFDNGGGRETKKMLKVGRREDPQWKGEKGKRKKRGERNPRFGMSKIIKIQLTKIIFIFLFSKIIYIIYKIFKLFLGEYKLRRDENKVEMTG